MIQKKNIFFSVLFSIEIFFLAFFYCIYANAYATVWTLYFYEQDDIAAFYSEPGNSDTSGKAYVANILQNSSEKKEAKQLLDLSSLKTLFCNISSMHIQPKERKLQKRFLSAALIPEFHNCDTIFHPPSQQS